MKICLVCNHRFDATSWRCPRCQAAPPEAGGILLFAPSLAKGNSDFKVEWFSDLAALENGHFWFRNRNRLLVWALRTYFPTARRFLEIGCGTGFVLSGLGQAIPTLELAGSELFLDGLTFARERLPGVPLYQMDAHRIPFEAEFDVLGAFDVLEHIDEDQAVLRQMYQATRIGGGVLLTVPQHPSLWSTVDDRSCHKRRYTRRELVSKVESAGFKVCRVTSFVTLLLPVLWLSRRRSSEVGTGDRFREYPMSPTVNRVLEAILTIETCFIRGGGSLPAGGSLLLVAKRT
jgi:SAM-dependent methyltransferase